MDDGLEEVHREPELLLATWETVFISIWRARRVHRRLIQEIADAERRFSDGTEGKHALITVIDVDVASGIDDDAKKLSVQHAKSMDRKVDANVQVVVGSGLKRYAAQVVIKATFTLSRPSYPTKVTRDFRQGAEWLAGVHGAATPALGPLVDRLYRDHKRR